MRLQAVWLVRKGPSLHDGAAAIGGHPRTVPAGGGVGAEGGARRRAAPAHGRAWSCLPTERRAGRRADAAGCCGSVSTGAGCGGVGERAGAGGRPLVGDGFARSARGMTEARAASVHPHGVGGRARRLEQRGRAPAGAATGARPADVDGRDDMRIGRRGQAPGRGRRAGERSSSREHGSAHGSP